MDPRTQAGRSDDMYFTDIFDIWRSDDVYFTDVYFTDVNHPVVDASWLPDNRTSSSAETPERCLSAIQGQSLKRVMRHSNQRQALATVFW